MAELNTVPNQASSLRRPVLRDLSVSILIFLASRASIMGMFPFGAAFFASGFDKGIAYIGILMMCAGLFSVGAKASIIKYLIASLLYWVYVKTRKQENKTVESIVCGISVFIGGASILIYNYVNAYDVMMLITESVISSGVFIIFTKSHEFLEKRKERNRISQEELISVAVCAGIFITGLSGIKLPYNISASNILSLYAAMCITLHSNLSAAGCGAMCIGFIGAVSTYMPAITCGFYGISAIFGNLLKSLGRVGVAAGFIGGISAAVLCSKNIEIPFSAADIVLSVMLFLITPKAVHKRMNIFFSKSLHIEAVSADVRLKEYLSMKLENAANAFKSLKECFIKESDNRLNLYRKEVNSFFDEICTRVCADCSMSGKCWQNDFERTYKNILLLLEKIEEEGVITNASMNSNFRERCIRDKLFVSEFNHVYELYKKNIIRMGEASSERDIIAKQYNEMSELLQNISTDVLEGFSFREDYEEKVVTELDKSGITAFEVSVVESSFGYIEVYLGLGIGINIEKIESILTEIFEVPIGIDEENSGDLIHFITMPRYYADVVLRQVKSDETDVSGDSAASFTVGKCKKYIVISDGMGSGKKAMYESSITLRLLREFLVAGFSPESSIGIINSSLCLKLDKEMFSTIDLLCIDLITGNAEFYKIGAAESLISHENSIETVFSASVPAGMLSDIKPQCRTKKLSEGDIIIMMSDGISETNNVNIRNEWIKQKLRTSPSNIDGLIQDVIETVIEKNHGIISDDMTIAAVKITENIIK